MTRTAAVAVWVAAGVSIALVDSDPLSRAVVLAAAWVVLVRRRMAGRRLRPLAIGMGVLGTSAVVINGLVDHTGATVVLLVPSWVPVVGGPVTAEAFAYGASVALGLMAAVSVAAALSVVVEPSDLVDGLPRPLARTGVALGAALNLVPNVALSVRSITDAQRMRGWRPRGVRGLVDLAVPVLLDTIEQSMQLAESMESRGFGAGRRTSAVVHRRRGVDLVVGVGALLTLAGLVATRLAGWSGAWYPFPTVAAPSLALPLLAPPVALALLGLWVSPSPA